MPDRSSTGPVTPVVAEILDLVPCKYGFVWLLGEALLQGRCDLPGDTELVEHPANQKATTMDVERRVRIVLVPPDCGETQRRELDLEHTWAAPRTDPADACRPNPSMLAQGLGLRTSGGPPAAALLERA